MFFVLVAQISSVEFNDTTEVVFPGWITGCFGKVEVILTVFGNEVLTSSWAEALLPMR